MSGHTDFTNWIDTQAEYVMIDGKKENIQNTFFTSDGMHNSDTFNIKTDRGCYTLSDEKLDFKELSNRH